MSNTGKRIGALIGLAALATAALALMASPAHAGVPKTDECATHMDSGDEGSVSVVTSPAGQVAPGGDAVVTTSWNPHDWVELNRILTCVKSDGTFSPALSGGEKPADNDGEFAWQLSVPAGTAEGTELCVRSVVFGKSLVSLGTQRSGFACFTVASVPSTTTTTSPPPPPSPVIDPPAPDVVPSAAPVPAPTGVVVGEQTTQPEVLAELPRTGSATGALLVASLVALLLGGVALALGRRQSSTEA